ncbi:Gfo/Idh/MocA family oxidoreductase [Candidatus Nomurabacteria bacterium]|nr:Gfo/Idh/MocA family oxidoreductase [Candidatus Nomurabacteria bacterium]
MKTVNVLVIGVGPHARRIYVPAFFKLAKDYPVKLVAAVDISPQKDLIDNYITDNEYDMEMLYLDPFDPSRSIPKSSMEALDDLTIRHNINGVVIATEPTAHKVYAEWALRRGLHILMDKPVSTRKWVSVDINQARSLIDDYNELLELYKLQQKKEPTLFSVNVQRRYEHGFDKVKELVLETSKKFNVPITSMQIMHADGSWRFPREVLFQDSHGLFEGMGKVSHSGYHLLDMAWQLYKTSQVKEKAVDELEFFSSPLTPVGLDVCINEEDYIRYFGDNYEKTGLSRKEYLSQVRDYGELDSFNIIRLLKDGENVCNISVSLLHSSFSARSWVIPSPDLYKGNGRVKHQQFILQQGPFQSIHIHNYQSSAQHDIDNSNQFDVGGNNHFDIYVFRNATMYGEKKPFTKISGYELENRVDSGLTGENAKHRVIIEYIEFILGKIKLEEVRSNIDSHEISVKMLSGVCQSGALIRSKMSSLVRMLI